MNFGGIIGGLGTARLGQQQGRKQRQDEEAAKQEQIKQMMFRLALEESARRQTQANSDRDFGLRKTESGLRQAADVRAEAANARAAEHQTWMESQPKPPQLGQPEHEAAVLRLKEAEAKIGAQYREDPVKNAIAIAQATKGIPTYGDLHKSQTETTKPPTEAQAKAAAFARVAEPEEATIAGMESNLPNKYTAKIPVLGNILTGKQHPDYQKQQAAGERWINQYLRFQSGAAISESEFENARKQFIPQPGDTPATIAAKTEARARVVAGLKAAAGNTSTGSDAGETPAQIAFKAASMKLRTQADAAIARGVNPSLVQMKLDTEMNKLRKQF